MAGRGALGQGHPPLAHALTANSAQVSAPAGQESSYLQSTKLLAAGTRGHGPILQRHLGCGSLSARPWAGSHGRHLAQNHAPRCRSRRRRAPSVVPGGAGQGRSGGGAARWVGAEPGCASGSLRSLGPSRVEGLSRTNFPATRPLALYTAFTRLAPRTSAPRAVISPHSVVPLDHSFLATF